MKSFISTVVILFCSITLFAQSSPQDRAHTLSTEMKAKLSLTDVQFENVSVLNEGVELKIEAINNDQSMTPEKKDAFIKGNRNDQMNALSLILTPGQMEELKTHKEEIFSVIE